MSVNLKRLSEISTAATAPSSIDKLVGVQSGGDVLFNVSDIGGGLKVGSSSISGGTNQYLLYDNSGVLGERLGPFPLAGGNLVWYVSTTGSDSNPGTIGSPFATIQHAANIAGSYDYGGTFFPTINVQAGTFTSAVPIQLPQLVNVLPPGGFISGAGHALTTVKHSVSTGGDTSNPVFLATGQGSQWNFQNLGTDHSGYHYIAANLAHLGLNSTTLDFQESGNHGNAFLFGCDASGGGIDVNFSTININIPWSPGFQDFVQLFRLGAFGIFQTTIVWFPGAFPASFCQTLLDTQFNDVGTAAISWLNVTNTNGAGLQVGQKGLTSASGGDVFITLDNGLDSDLPGTPVFGGLALDNTVYLLSNALSFEGVGLQQFSLPPRVLSSTFYQGKDSGAPTGAGIRTLVNDAGTIFSLGSGAPYQTSAPTTGGTVASSYGLRSNIVNPGGALGSLTVNLPTGVIDGDITRIAFTQAITSLTIASTVGATIIGAPTSAAAGSAFQFLYSSTSTSTAATPIWYIN